ncbi:MmgE/PrpD family protein [uncultured Nisaea sp.]|mgnify:FL=1|uniref:MmgE/PrpD family protein n=1 Tax=uncultured Nisaea sp. TaxID=538215 RepID=UPI0030EF8865|tara:strand:- start:452 stop:1828 length:1377 start_codon:yes stop_codon:yes gene_type:complete
MANKSPTETFGDFIAAMSGMPVPEAAHHHAKRCVLDWFAAAVPGGVLPPATLLPDAVPEDLDRGRARLVPSGRFATARAAALINGAGSHTVEFDDIYRDGLYHPGVAVIPAALALAEETGADGALFLRAVIAGYEVSNRIAAAVNPAHYDYWHTTATIGYFGGTASASVLLGLTASEAAHALASAGTMAAGLQQAFRAEAMSKPLHAGRASEGGVLAARMAKAGITGALDILEGAAGLGAAMSRDVDWNAAVKGLGSDWTIERTTQKNHAACGHVHAAVDAVREIVTTNNIAAESIQRIEAGSYQKSLEICGNADPKTAFEAKFSLPYCLGAVIATGAVRIAAFSPEALANPAIRDIAAKVEHMVDPECDAAFPRRRSAKVTVETRDGQRFSHYAQTRKGDPDLPLSDAELDEKFFELTGDVLGAAAGPLRDALWRIDTLASLSELPFGTIEAKSAAE